MFIFYDYTCIYDNNFITFLPNTPDFCWFNFFYVLCVNKLGSNNDKVDSNFGFSFFILYFYSDIDTFVLNDRWVLAE